IAATPFLDLTGSVSCCGEQGLLGLAFHPDPADPRLFVYYTDAGASQVLASYAMDAERPVADPASARILLTMDDPFDNHNGGSLAFGPDGSLYVGTGDGGGGGDPLGSGRHLDTLLAKVLRIDVDGGTDDAAYGIPVDNPFVGRADARPEIWHTGLRNPWRMRFDRTTGDLWIGDVGQGAREEIDRAPAGVGGLDFGWNLMEGFACYSGSGPDCGGQDLTLPVADYGHDQGCSVTGGTVYRGAAHPELVGWYLFSDYCSGTIWAIDADLADPTARQEPIVVAETGESISAIGEDAAGELFLTDLGGSVRAIGVSASGT
ncbi:MAG TPA: PQQ-dependent sugar dehydrogenase, partial [Candidatus Limnocylindrales bacterium]